MIIYIIGVLVSDSTDKSTVLSLYNKIVLQALQTDFPCAFVALVLYLHPLKTTITMKAQNEETRKLSFVCSRKELYKVLSTIKMRSNAKVTIATRLAEHLVILKTNYYEIPIPCIECSGKDASFSILLLGIKTLCELSTNDVIHFSLEGETLQIDTTFLNVK